MDDLIALATVPLARLPHVPLWDWLGVLRGDVDPTGVPIPDAEIEVPLVWRPVIAAWGAPRAKMAAAEILNRLHSREEAGWRLYDPEVTVALLGAHAWLASSFVVDGERFDFEDHVGEADRQALRREVRARFRPHVCR